MTSSPFPLRASSRVAAWAILCPVLALSSTGCSSIYYGTMSTFGWEKRDILVDRIENTREDQKAAKEEFKSALERFRGVVNVQGGELEKKYDELKAAYDQSQSRAGKVTSRIQSVEKVAADLFEEWKTEIGQISDVSLRSKSEDLLQGTRTRYDGMLAAMRKAERSMSPVLERFNNQVLYLKHNLNAQAIAGLDKDLAAIESDVTVLIQEMEASIAEADKFITSFESK